MFAICDTHDELVTGNSQNESKLTPDRMPINDTDVPILDQIMTGFGENMHSMNDDVTEIDLNTFKFESNYYQNNFIVRESALVNTYKIYSLTMHNESYIANTGMYKEALNHFGSISANMDDETEESGAFRFSHYFANEGIIFTASSDIKHTYYPYSIVLIDSSMVIDIDEAEFDGNYLIYQFPLTQTITQFSETFTFQY